MRLTPADVHNVAFKKPSIGKRGYDEDEVDAFLDLVENELARLIEENNELTGRLAASQGDSGIAASHPADQPTERDTAGSTAAESMVSIEKTEPPVASAPVSSLPGDVHGHAARLLSMAQEMADRLTGDAAREAEETKVNAKTESDKLLTDARNQSERMLSDAKNESDRVRSEAHTESEKVRGDAKAESERLLTEAKNRSESMISEAMGKAEALERDSRVRAEAMDREAQSKYSQAMGTLTEQRTTLEKKIDDLRIYEREYRSRLKSWITDQLSQLGDGGTEKAAVTDGVAQKA